MADDSLLVNGSSNALITLVLAHGAGAAMDSRFMNIVAEAIAGAEVRVVRFEFPYMAAQRTSGKRGDAAKIVIGGKSMGGRIASMVADEAGVAGLVCLGYPFHPPGNPARTRTKHLENLRTPALIIQGTRDTFGRPDEVAKYKLSKEIRIIWIEAGDHSLKPPARS